MARRLICGLPSRLMQLAGAALLRAEQLYQRDLLCQYSGRSRVLIAAVRTPAVVSSSIFARPGTKPPPGKKGPDSKYDPIKRKKEIV